MKRCIVVLILFHTISIFGMDYLYHGITYLANTITRQQSEINQERAIQSKSEWHENANKVISEYKNTKNAPLLTDLQKEEQLGNKLAYIIIHERDDQKVNTIHQLLLEGIKAKHVVAQAIIKIYQQKLSDAYEAYLPNRQERPKIALFINRIATYYHAIAPDDWEEIVHDMNSFILQYDKNQSDKIEE